MPLQTYSCPACGREFEKLVRNSDYPPDCPECRTQTVQIWSKPAVAQWSCSRGSL